MYLLFRLKHMNPHEYYALTAGQKRVTREFLRIELAEVQKELDDIAQKTR